jgi:spermidine/putrescine transport system permease protein
MSAGANAIRRAPFLGAYTLIVFAFLYLPIAVLVLYSFNKDGVGGFPPKHFTLNWYRQLFRDASIWNSFLNSLLVAVAAVVLALVLGLLAALALDRADFAGKSIFRRLVLLPLILPGIITGLSLLMFAVFSGLPRSWHRAHLRRHHRNLRRPAKNGSRAGRSLPRSRRHALANVLAHHAS